MITEGNRINRLVAIVVAAAALFGACGGRQEIFADGGRQQRGAGAAFDEMALPETIPAVPAFSVTSSKPLSSSAIKKINSLDGVALAVPVTTKKLAVKAGKKSVSLQVATAPILDLRSVSPAATKAADFVWFALIGGDAVITPDAADALKLGDSTAVSIKGIGDVTVGAMADNATPNFADIVLSVDGYPKLGAPRTLVVGAESGVTLNALEDQIRKTIKGARVTWLLPKSESIATQEAAASVGGTITVPSVAGLHPALAQAVNTLISASGGRIWIVSGYRDTARQYQLWLRALEKYGDPEVADNWVAPPGGSYHERGLAVDLGGDLNLAVQLVQELNLPLWRPMSWEDWHFELAGSRG
jgi:hypothetical protein